MGLTAKIAWRNIWRHKGKCLVIGTILFIGSLFMTVGNSVITGMNMGLSENIVDLFTGDILIISDEQEQDNVLMDIMTGKPLKVIKDYESVESAIDPQIVSEYLPATAGVVFGLDETAEMVTYMMLGVNMDRYQAMFPDNFRVLEGRSFQTGERGVLIPQLIREQSYSFLDYWLLPHGEELNEAHLTDEARQYRDNLEIRRDLIFMGSNPSGGFFDVQVPVTGIIEYRALNRIWGNYTIVDIESFREAHNYVTGADSSVEISEEQRALLSETSVDDLFAFDDLFTDIVVDEDILASESLGQTVSAESLEYDLDAGSFNLVFVRLNEGVAQEDAIAQLNKRFAANNLDVRAIGWQDSVGIIGNMAVMIKAALNIFVMSIFFVAIIIIMNTLSMAALERITEIAMMRAIGAQKRFLKNMFLLETSTLSFFFGGLGMAVGVLVVYLLRSANITTENEILQMVFGGNSFNPVFTLTDLAIGIGQLSVVTVLSVLYPLRVVGKIVPLDAIARD